MQKRIASRTLRQKMGESVCLLTWVTNYLVLPIVHDGFDMKMAVILLRRLRLLEHYASGHGVRSLDIRVVETLYLHR